MSEHPDIIEDQDVRRLMRLESAKKSLEKPWIGNTSTIRLLHRVGSRSLILGPPSARFWGVLPGPSEKSGALSFKSEGEEQSDH